MTTMLKTAYVAMPGMPKAQTMTEYVLIIAAIAVAGYLAYQGLETSIEGIITSVSATLAAA